ncbi:MAG: hypothetical protein BMS9Abin05_0383 [Rhodothermia bacterium]|nr:MAG: hypothetical protein BMS9Abin05_0383 [Rhodothermia bacterium]
MTEHPNISNFEDSACSKKSSEILHQYLDGELALDVQSSLFEHMADCESCRRMMESVLAFRRMSRQEFLAYPPAADDIFFERLAKLKKQSDQIDREEDRKPLWNAKRSISLRSALALASIVFLIGLFVPMPSRTNYATALIQFEVERVQFEPTDSVVIESPIYHWVDGITVEAVRTDSQVPDETL